MARFVCCAQSLRRFGLFCTSRTCDLEECDCETQCLYRRRDCLSVNGAGRLLHLLSLRLMRSLESLRSSPLHSFYPSILGRFVIKHFS